MNHYNYFPTFLSGGPRQPRDPSADNGQEASNQQPGVRQANQRGQRPNFFGAAPRGSAPAPTASPRTMGQPPGQAPSKFFQQGFTPDAWVNGKEALATRMAGQPDGQIGQSTPSPMFKGGNYTIPDLPAMGEPASSLTVPPSIGGGGGGQPPMLPPTGGGGAPGTPPANSQMSALVRSLVERLAAQAPTDTTGIKEGQKESLIAQREQQRMAAEASAARRGVGGGGNLGAQEATLGDQFAGNLTGAYRDVDQAAVAQDFERLMQTAQLAESVGNNEMAQFFQQQALDLQRELGRGGLDVQRQQVGNQASQFLRSQAFQEAMGTAGMDMDFWRMLMDLMG